MIPRRHPSRARLLADDERALRHAETCERCADLLLEDDAPALGAELRGALRAVLAPRDGFATRARAGAADRIEMQDLWDLVGDTFGGVADAARELAPQPPAPDDEER